MPISYYVEKLSPLLNIPCTYTDMISTIGMRKSSVGHSTFLAYCHCSFKQIHSSNTAPTVQVLTILKHLQSVVSCKLRGHRAAALIPYVSCSGLPCKFYKSLCKFRGLSYVGIEGNICICFSQLLLLVLVWMLQLVTNTTTILIGSLGLSKFANFLLITI